MRSNSHGKGTKLTEIGRYLAKPGRIAGVFPSLLRLVEIATPAKHRWQVRCGCSYNTIPHSLVALKPLEGSMITRQRYYCPPMRKVADSQQQELQRKMRSSGRNLHHLCPLYHMLFISLRWTAPNSLVLSALLRIFRLPNEASYSMGSWVMTTLLKTWLHQSIIIYIHFYK